MPGWILIFFIALSAGYSAQAETRTEPAPPAAQLEQQLSNPPEAESPDIPEDQEIAEMMELLEAMELLDDIDLLKNFDAFIEEE